MTKKTEEGIIQSADTNFQVWCKRTELATIVLWYEKNGISVRSKSQLGKMILEDFTTMIAKSGFEGVVRDTSEAIGILRERGLGELNQQRRGERVLLNKLQLEVNRPVIKEEEYNQEELVRIAKRYIEEHQGNNNSKSE